MSYISGTGRKNYYVLYQWYREEELLCPISVVQGWDGELLCPMSVVQGWEGELPCPISVIQGGRTTMSYISGTGRENCYVLYQWYREGELLCPISVVQGGRTAMS